MIKALLSDKVIINLKKAPNFVWYIVFAVSAFFADAYSVITTSSALVGEMQKMYAEQGMYISTIGFIIFISIITPIIGTLVFEIIARFCFTAVHQRFGIGSQVSKNDAVFRIRLVMIVANLVLGIVGISYFFYKPMIPFFVAVVDFSVITFFIFRFYEVFRKQYLSNRNQAKIYNFIAKFYFIVFLVVSFYSLFRNMLNPSSTAYSISLAIDFVVKLIWAGLAYWKYTKLKLVENDSDSLAGAKAILEDIFKQFDSKDTDPFDEFSSDEKKNYHRKDKDDPFEF